MKYLRKFENEAAYEAYKESEDWITPNVSLCTGENTVKYEPFIPLPPHDYSQDYLTIVSTSDNNTIRWRTNNTKFKKTISVSTDNGSTWIDKTSTTGGIALATLNTGDKLLIKGSNTAYSTTSDTGYYNYFISTGQFNLEGNIMSMIYGDNFIGQTTLPATYTFEELFCESGVVDASNLILPATTLTQGCYSYMFSGCTSLTTAPTLPATTLANDCYQFMFTGCSSLTTAPTLPATTLATGCYSYMFAGCTSLTTAPDISATTLANSCCTQMFRRCTSLTTAPDLSATTLANYCYQSMFSVCTSLTTGPTLPATTLADGCYYNMFSGCTQLNYIECLATNISASKCLTNWVSGVAPTGTFIKDSSITNWTTGDSGIPSGWTVEDAS